MGEVAGRLADFTVITSDNPRSEDPLAIIDAVETGIKAVGRERYAVQPDRREAIRQAFQLARAGDMVVIAGKGHENYQIIGDRKLPFDDREVAMEVLREMQPKR
jgi:UDP-N-acetylmuramoyl-L-alanyl-D-glutamate--2,6-diaminopimelate ligase